jgi:hypothetical protein
MYYEKPKRGPRRKREYREKKERYWRKRRWKNWIQSYMVKRRS